MADTQSAPSITVTETIKDPTVTLLKEKETGSPRSRRRSRSRTDSYLRKQRARAHDLENSDTTIVVVTNLRPGCHEELQKQLGEKFGDRVKTYHLAPEHNFGFIEFQDKDVLQVAIQDFDGIELNGGHISMQRCEAVTPGRNPLVWVLEEMGPPSKTIVVKNLPFDATLEQIKEALARVPQLHPFTDVSCRMTANGQFSGMAFVTFVSEQDAEHACQQMTGTELLSRKIRIEYKRDNNAKLTKGGSYTAPNAEAQALYDELKAFMTSPDAGWLTPDNFDPQLRTELTKIVQVLGLKHELDPTSGRLRICKMPLSPRSSRRAAKLAVEEPRPRAQTLDGSSNAAAKVMAQTAANNNPTRRSKLRNAFSPVPTQQQDAPATSEPAKFVRSQVAAQPNSPLMRPRAATHSGVGLARAKQADNVIRQPLGPTENQGFLPGRGRGKPLS